MDIIMFYECSTRFRNGHSSFEGQPCSGCSSTRTDKNILKTSWKYWRSLTEQLTNLLIYKWCAMKLLATNFDRWMVIKRSYSKVFAWLAHRRSRTFTTECKSWTGSFFPPKVITNDKSCCYRIFRCRKSEKNMAEALRGNTSQEFQPRFEQCKLRMDRCVASNGELKAIEV